MRTSNGLILGAIAIAITLSGALIALLSLGSAVNFDDWPRPPESGVEVRPGSTDGGNPAAGGVRRADARSLAGFVGSPPDDAGGSAPAVTLGELATVDTGAEPGLVPAFQRRQVARPRPREQRRADSLTPRKLPSPVAPAPAPAPKPTPVALPVTPPGGGDKPGKGGGGGPRPTTPGRGDPPVKPEPKEPKPEDPKTPRPAPRLPDPPAQLPKKPVKKPVKP